MDPTILSETLPGMPAPFWFVQFFKIVGFTLHMIPMGLWFAGLPVAIGCALWSCKHSSRYARRMFGQFPVVMALGINFGIVPLLFLQTTYYKSFYTATILMAWHWLAVIPILIVGYYALYLAAYSQRKNRMILFGLVASASLIAIGLLITNGLTLMVRSDLWPGIMERTGVYGATTGLANNFRDPAVWLRFATMFALGLMTTGVWAAFDSHFLLKTIEPGSSGPGKPAPEQNVDSAATLPGTDVPGSMDELTAYRRWTISLAQLLTVFGFLFLIGMQLYLARGNGNEAITLAYPQNFFGAMVALESFAMALICFENYRVYVFNKTAGLFLCLGMLMHIFGLAVFGIMRQLGQNAGVASYVDVTKIPTAVQWSPLLAFLVCFVLGLLVIAWMVRQCAICGEEPSSAPHG